MNASMRAAVYHGPGDVRIERVPLPPPPGPEDVCLRILTASLCGTDISQFLAPTMIPLSHPHPTSGHQGPLVLGHEVCGIVVAKGERVEHVAIGDRVAVGAGWWCGVCPRCLEGRPNICEEAFVYGLHTHGGLAERALFPAKMCVRVPDTCSSEAAALAQPLAVALHALSQSQIQASERVAIFGVGGVGSLMLAVLAVKPQFKPSLLIALDIDPVRLTRAIELGADATINPLVSNPFRELEQMTQARGIDLAIEATGQSATISQAVQAVRRGGRVLQVGIPSTPLVELPLGQVVVQEKTVLTTNGHVCPVNLPAALDLLTTTDLARRVGTRPIQLENLVKEGLLPQVEHRAPEKVIVMIG
ncbi:MAG TPA: alcohol dehydrogenase catalytic domain-containing protein [Ktedonobacteraceae bacterium]|nr:alcohol dehydrogenase catalytic domain-containing protein [Ktedonobacteraceae bacterium]